MTNKYKRLVIELAAIFIAAIIIMMVADYGRLLGVSIKSQNSIDKLVEGLEYSANIDVSRHVFINNCPIPVSDDGTLTIVQNDSRGGYSGEITFDDSISGVFFLRDSVVASKNNAIENGSVFKLYVLTKREYTVCDVRFSGLPYIFVDTLLPEIENETEYNSADAYIYDPNARGTNENTIAKLDVEIKESVNKEKYTIKNYDGKNRKEISLLDLGEYDAWSLYRISDKDDTYIRSALAYYVWNAINEDDSADIPYAFTELNVSGEYRGLFLITPRIDDDFLVAESVDKIEISYKDENIDTQPAEAVIREFREAGTNFNAICENYSPVNRDEYILFEQATYAFPNLYDNIYAVNSSDGNTDLLIPGKIEYSFGIFPGRFDWMKGNIVTDIISPDSLSITDYDSDSLCDKWINARKSELSSKAIEKQIDILSEQFINSGYITRGNRHIEDETGLSDYEKSLSSLYDYISKQFEIVDSYYDNDINVSDDQTEDSINTDGAYIDIELSLSGVEGSSIKLYVKDDICYIFAPDCLSNDSFEWKYDDSKWLIEIDEDAVENGGIGDIRALSSKNQIALTNLSSGEQRILNIDVMYAGNLPTLFINSVGGDKSWIDESKDHKEPCTISELEVDGSITEIESSWIKARGYSSFDRTDDKSYKISFSNTGSIIGMDEHHDWILQANAFDRTQLRNRIAYDFSRKLEIDYPIMAAYTDVYLDGEYAGCFLVLPDLDETVREIEESGGVLLAIDKQPGEYPNFEDYYGKIIQIQTPIDDDKKEQIEETIWNIEQLIEDSDNPSVYKKLAECIDIDSFAKMFIIDMVTNEVDQNMLSTFYYFDGIDGKLHAGPVWDYDRSLGSDAGYAGYVEMNHYFDGLPEKLFVSSKYRNEVRRIFEEYGVMEAYIQAEIDGISDAIEPSAQIEKILYGYMFEWSIDSGDYNTEVLYLKHYFYERYSLVREIVSTNNYHKISIVVPGNIRSIWIKDGETISYDLLEKINLIDGRLMFPNGTKVSCNYPIYDDMVLYSSEYLEESNSEENEYSDEAQNEADLDVESGIDIKYWAKRAGIEIVRIGAVVALVQLCNMVIKKRTQKDEKK